MIKTLTGIFILLSSISYAQDRTGATQFDEFISKSAIEWAAYVNDEVKFEKVQLNRLLLERLIKKEIKATLPVYYGLNDANPITYLDKDSVDNVMLYPGNRLLPYDSTGNDPAIDPETSKNGLHTDSLIFTDIIQILYVENGRLKSYVPWVSPMMPIRTSQGLYLGSGDYFSTCFSFRYNHPQRKKRKDMFLTETKRRINLDSAGVISNIKQLYDRNLVETLWPFILEGKPGAFSVETDTRLKKEEINEYLLNKTRIAVPVYDSTGTPSGFEYRRTVFEPGKITRIELVQDWYYSRKDNIVFNKIKELFLYVKTASADEENPGYRPVLKIVFN